MYKKSLTPGQALQKLKHYCGYSERCHSEVKKKLYELGVSSIEHDEIMATLIEENYLNEERFAIQFAGGKFRMNQWGRQKIRYALKEKKVSEYCIKRGLEQIDENDYEKTLNDLAIKKYHLFNDDALLIRKKKVINYLVQKGFEADLVNAAVRLNSE